MSQATARPLPVHRAQRGTNPSATRPRLKLVQPAEASGSGVGFVVLCVTLLVAGLLTVLLLNTARAQQQYTIGDLQNQTARLSATEQDLDTKLNYVRAPQQVALRAQELGLVPAGHVRYVRASDHRLVGVAQGTGSTAPFTVSTLPRTPASPVADLAVKSAVSAALVEQPKPKQAPPAKSSAASASASPKSPAASEQSGATSTTGTTSKATETSTTSKTETPKKTNDKKTTSPTPTSVR